MGGIVKVLSIDGGGMMGIIPALVLDEIERRTSKPISSMFHLISGTSTGGILAVGLTKPDSSGKPDYSAAELARLYEQEGRRIFPKPRWRGFPLVGTIADVFDEKYPSAGIEAVAAEYFGDARLTDSLTDVLVTAYEIEQRFPFFFKSAKARKNAQWDFRIRDVARATSAAPTYFEPHKIDAADPNDPNGYYALIDGGVYANNPAMCAYVEAKAMFPDADEIVVVSLGTGELTRPIPISEAKSWGLGGWVRPLIGVIFDGVSDTVDYQLRQILPAREGLRRYYRFQIPLTIGNDEMDDASQTNIRALQFLGKELIRTSTRELDQLIELLGSNDLENPTANDEWVLSPTGRRIRRVGTPPSPSPIVVTGEPKMVAKAAMPKKKPASGRSK